MQAVPPIPHRGTISIPLTTEWHDQTNALHAFRINRMALAAQISTIENTPPEPFLRQITACIEAPARRIPLTSEESAHATLLLQNLQTSATQQDPHIYSCALATALLFVTLPHTGQVQPALLEPWLARIISAAANGYALISVGDDSATTAEAMHWCTHFTQQMKNAHQTDILRGGSAAWTHHWLPLLGFDITAINFYSTPFSLKNFVATFGQLRAEAFAAYPASGMQGDIRIIGTLPPRPSPDTRHRIALFCSHPTAHGHGLPHIIWWLACLDRTHFEPVLVLRQLPENITLIEDLLRHYKNLAEYAPIIIVNDANLSQLQQFDFDLLYNFDDQCRGRSERPGYMRLAKNQVTAFYTPATTGCTEMDYFITSHDLDPTTKGEFTEQVIISPGLPFCFHYESYFGITPQWVRRDHDIPQNAIIYTMGSSMLTKVRPEFIDVLLEIMRRVPNAYCVAMPTSRPKDRIHLTELIMRKCAATGIAPSRFRFYPITSRQLLHGLMSISDVFLDFFPFSGTNNLMDPIAMATPCVTLCPPGFSRNRIGGCILRLLKLDEMVTETEQGYINLAVKLGTDSAYRQQLRARMGRKTLEESPLCDGPTFVARMETAMTTILQMPISKREDNANV
jgi:hypothetical protein